MLTILLFWILTSNVRCQFVIQDNYGDDSSCNAASRIYQSYYEVDCLSYISGYCSEFIGNSTHVISNFYYPTCTTCAGDADDVEVFENGVCTLSRSDYYIYTYGTPASPDPSNVFARGFDADACSAVDLASTQEIPPNVCQLWGPSQSGKYFCIGDELHMFYYPYTQDCTGTYNDTTMAAPDTCTIGLVGCDAGHWPFVTSCDAMVLQNPCVTGDVPRVVATSYGDDSTCQASSMVSRWEYQTECQTFISDYCDEYIYNGSHIINGFHYPPCHACQGNPGQEDVLTIGECVFHRSDYIIFEYTIPSTPIPGNVVVQGYTDNCQTEAASQELGLDTCAIYGPSQSQQYTCIGEELHLYYYPTSNDCSTSYNDTTMATQGTCTSGIVGCDPTHFPFASSCYARVLQDPCATVDNMGNRMAVCFVVLLSLLLLF